MRQLIICFIFPLFILACSPTIKGAIKLHKTSQEMQKEVSKFIIVDMPIENVEQILKKNKFNCENYKDGDDNNLIFNSFKTKGDLLICNTTHYYLIANKSWIIYILHKNKKVFMVKAVVTDQNL